MQIYAGTSGYSYKEWKGSFYPEKLPAAQMLHHYAGLLPTVEINNTFYRMPKRSVFEAWTQQVPAAFRFAIKASRRITHSKPLRDSEEVLAFLVENLAALGERLGVVLFQLPPYLKCDESLLSGFLASLPEDLPAAFEFRHSSWHETPEVAELLRARNMALVHADTGEDSAPLVATADFGYLRLRRPDYDEAGLGQWLTRIKAQDWQRCFVFFKHEGEGTGPAFARSLLALASD